MLAGASQLRRLLIALLLAALIVVLLGRVYTVEATPAAVQPAPQWVIDAVYASATRWGAHPARMLETLRCETGGTFSPNAANPNRLDHGIAQFRIHPSGYSIISEAPAAQGLSVWAAVYDPYVSIDAMAWWWGTSPGVTGAMHWACYQMLYQGRVYA